MRRDKKIPRVKLEEQHAPRRAGVQFGDFVAGPSVSCTPVMSLVRQQETTNQARDAVFILDWNIECTAGTVLEQRRHARSADSSTTTANDHRRDRDPLAVPEPVPQ